MILFGGQSRKQLNQLKDRRVSLGPGRGPGCHPSQLVPDAGHILAIAGLKVRGWRRRSKSWLGVS